MSVTLSRGWKLLQESVDKFQGVENFADFCGNAKARRGFITTAGKEEGLMDPPKALEIKNSSFFNGLLWIPHKTASKKLKQQLMQEKVKLFLQYPLHAKLYLMHKRPLASLIIVEATI